MGKYRRKPIVIDATGHMAFIAKRGDTNLTMGYHIQLK